MKPLEEIPCYNHFCSLYSNVSIFPFIPASFTITCCFCSFFRKGKLEANRLLQIFLMDYRDLMAWMTDLAMRISSGEPAKNVREAEALLELHMERKVPNVQIRSCCSIVVMSFLSEKRDSRRQSTMGVGENVIVRETSYQLLEVL